MLLSSQRERHCLARGQQFTNAISLLITVLGALTEPILQTGETEPASVKSSWVQGTTAPCLELNPPRELLGARAGKGLGGHFVHLMDRRTEARWGVAGDQPEASGPQLRALLLLGTSLCWQNTSAPSLGPEAALGFSRVVQAKG